MENASKALSIAGSVLIGVLVLALLITFYRNLSSYEKTKADIELQSQTSDFNKQFYTYQEDLYGSELFSLVNKIADYNERESNNKGYTPITVSVKFNYKSYEEKTKTGFMSGQTYKNDELYNRMSNLTNKISQYGNMKIPSGAEYTISQLALMRSDDRANWRKKNDYHKNNSLVENMENTISLYQTLKSNELTIKSRKYRYIDSEYDKNTGRITSINFVEMN